MALVQVPPVSAEPHKQDPPTLEVPGHAPSYRELHAGGRRRAPCSDSPQDGPPQSVVTASSSRGQQSRKYIFTSEDEWCDGFVGPGSDADELKEVGGPPPQLVPVSGRLEKVNTDWPLQALMSSAALNLLLPPVQNVETPLLLRPTAFKPFVPRSRAAVHFLSPRGGPTDPPEAHQPHGSSHREASPSGRAHAGAPSCLVERSLQAYESSTCHLEATRSAVAGGAHSNSDSGRSSSKSSGSLSSRAPPASPPPPGDVYEGVVRDLEEKLRERELELQQLRDNLDENEAAICQVGNRLTFAHCLTLLVSLSFCQSSLSCSSSLSHSLFLTLSLFLSHSLCHSFSHKHLLSLSLSLTHHHFTHFHFVTFILFHILNLFITHSLTFTLSHSPSHFLVYSFFVALVHSFTH